MINAPRPPDSGVRAVPHETGMRELVERLQDNRARVVAALADLDATLAEVAPHLAAPAIDPADPDAGELAHLRALGSAGRMVVMAVQGRGVALRDVLGPGAPPTRKAAEARRRAIAVLVKGQVTPTDIAIVMRLSAEAVRRLRKGGSVNSDSPILSSADATPLPIAHVLEEPAPSAPLRELPTTVDADDPEVMRRAPSALGSALAWGDRKRPPQKRRNRTSEARIGHEGGHKIHLTVDIDEAERPCAIWVEMHKEGAPFRSTLDTVAALASRLLQCGQSLREVAGEMLGIRFEPSGPVVGHDAITECTSLVDLLGQMLLAEFPGGEATR